MKRTLSESSPYYISEYRRKELEYFVRQYPEWKKCLRELDGCLYRHSSIVKLTKVAKDTINSVQSVAEQRDRYWQNIDIVDSAIESLPVSSVLKGDILRFVTIGDSYDKMNARTVIPCGRRQFYEYVRIFYCKLDIIKS